MHHVNIKHDRRDYDHGIVVGARKGFKKLVLSCDFHTQLSWEFTHDGAKNKQTSSQWTFYGLRRVGEEWQDWIELTNPGLAGTLGSTPFSQEQESETTVGTDSPKPGS